MQCMLVRHNYYVHHINGRRELINCYSMSFYWTLVFLPSCFALDPSHSPSLLSLIANQDPGINKAVALDREMITVLTANIHAGRYATLIALRSDISSFITEQLLIKDTKYATIEHKPRNLGIFGKHAVVTWVLTDGHLALSSCSLRIRAAWRD
jgi:hypothetical protein